MKTCLLLGLATALMALSGCASETLSLEDARDSYFATVTGSDDACADWLQWCIDEGYPQAACEERNEYCVDGEWVRGDDDDSVDPCDAEAEAAYQGCIDDGGTPEACRQVAADAHDDCADE